MAAGSSFAHASGHFHPLLSLPLDNVPIGLMGYAAHQISVSTFSNSSLLYRLAQSENQTRKNSSYYSRQFITIISEEDVYDWGESFHSKVEPELPDYTLESFPAFVV